MSLGSKAATHEVTVQTYDGESAYGSAHLPARRVRVRVEAERTLVRNAGGDEVVSEMQLFSQPRLADLDTADEDDRVSATDLFKVESIVTVGDYTTRVIRTQEFAGRGAPRYVLVTLA